MISTNRRAKSSCWWKLRKSWSSGRFRRTKNWIWEVLLRLLSLCRRKEYSKRWSRWLRDLKVSRSLRRECSRVRKTWQLAQILNWARDRLLRSWTWDGSSMSCWRSITDWRASFRLTRRLAMSGLVSLCLDRCLYCQRTWPLEEIQSVRRLVLKRKSRYSTSSLKQTLQHQQVHPQLQSRT